MYLFDLCWSLEDKTLVVFQWSVQDRDMIKSSALGKQHQLWRAPGPQREGLQTQLCPGLLIRPCSLLEVPVRLQIFSTSASAEKKQTHRSDTTDTQTTPARCRECAREVRGQHDFKDRHAWHQGSALNTQSNAGNTLCKHMVDILQTSGIIVVEWDISCKYDFFHV